MIRDGAFQRHQASQLAHWNRAAGMCLSTMARCYHRRLHAAYCFNIAPKLCVLELGCGTGDLLAAVQPRHGFGIDLSPEMIRIARTQHPGLKFEVADAHEYYSKERFDFVILSDLIGSLYDVQSVLEKVQVLCKSDGRIIMNFFSHIWEKPLTWSGALRLSRPAPVQNWLTTGDVTNLLSLTGFEPIRYWTEFIFPFSIPLIEPLFNRYLARLWPTSALCLTNFIVARPQPVPRPLTGPESPSVSVVIPACNEAGNVPQFFTRVPRMGSHTDIVIVEGHSRDDTYITVENCIKNHPD